MSTRDEERETERKVESPPCVVYNQLRSEKQLCDVVIRADGAEFHAHRNILCGCSSYFRALFTGSWHPGEKREYAVSDVPADIMQLILEYAYVQRADITEDNVQSLLNAADYLAVGGLVNECCAFISARLSLENCVGVWRFAHFYLLKLLKQQAFGFILHRFEQLVDVSEEFLELTAEQLSEIIENDRLNVKQESGVFEAVLHWMGHAPHKRRAHMAALLPKVRLALLTRNYFLNKVRKNALVKGSTACRPIINRVLIGFYSSHRPPRSELSRPRLPCSVLLAIGGWSRRAPTNALEAYDMRTDRWVNVTCNNESPRAYHGAVYLRGFVYCVGGYDGINYYNSVRRFDPVTRTWAQLGCMHCYRAYVSVCALDDRIYAMGGYDGEERLNSVERFEPDNNQWSYVAPMQQQRSDASAASLNGRAYVCGGFDGSRCSFTAEVYDPRADQWTYITRMSCRRSGVGVAAYRGQVYAVGGYNGVRRLKSAEVYNPQSNSWRPLPPMSNQRSNFGIEVADDLLFVVGGFSGFTTVFEAECYHVETARWYRVKELEIHRSALSCCVLTALPNVAEYAAPRDRLPRQVPQSIQTRIRNAPSPPPNPPT